ncbi:choice-of-anchor D domain-containing protein [Elongatibacter sediminis]|uniref:Choice-of-anchor D domain-containing protein n=1 Tax=Elongatibacter sediminis TaxID=3119006 RepID=A0AAW9RGN2_9GAMM
MNRLHLIPLLVLPLAACALSPPASADIIVNDGFEDGDANGWTTTGNVAVNGLKAIGNYSLRHKGTANSVLHVATTGYSAVSVTMNLAATSLENGEDCYAEVSTNGGSAWTQVVHVGNGSDNSTFYSNTVTPAGADDNADLQLRFRGTGGQTGDYCWGDEITVSGTPGGIDPEPDISISGNGAFGNVDTGTQSDRVLTVSNDGTANLVIGSLSGLATPFSLQADACSSATLTPSQSCQVTVRFAPSSTGYQSDTLDIPSNDPDTAVLQFGVNGTGTEPGGGGFDPNFDPLSGSGNVSRSALTYSTLQNGSDPGSLVDLSAYSVPAEAAQPDHVFEGSLQLTGEATGGDFDEHKDTYRYTNNKDNPRKHLPEFDFEFVQTGTHLFPVERGTMTDSHPYWEYILEAGRVWKENSDSGWSRASIPFTLHQKNANCMHNGVLTFLFKDDGSTSKAAYQISSETCLYYKFDMWGLLDADYTPGPVANANDLRAAYQDEVNGRMPVKPLADLATDYPGADPSQFGGPAEVDPDHLTAVGFVIDGTHYVGGCETRNGTYPYCDNLALPSYSSAKSVFAGVALMRMELKHPGFMNTTVASHVPDCAADGNWNDVPYRHVIDMATGNYQSALYMSDEGASHTNDLFLPEDHASKIDYSCTQYSRKASPGSTWVYHTSDTYILGTAMNAQLKALEGSGKDIFDDILVEEIWKPIGMSPASQVSRRTYDGVQQPFTGWGLTFLRDDVAKVTQFLNMDDGRVNGQLVVDSFELDAALQRDPSDRGIDTSATGFKYNNGFWAHDIAPETGCSGDLWIPFMSGFGGITVLLLPNDTVYYVWSDDDTYLWEDAAIESHQIRSMCP